MPDSPRFALTALATLLLIGSPSPLPASDAGEPASGYSSYLELRVYETVEDQRDRFLDYFEEHYLESQEEAGMRIWGQFRDLDARNQFVWMRGYRSMEERQTGLFRFYTSPLWNRTGPQVREMLARRATHVHFLEPVSPGDALDDGRDRSEFENNGVVVAQVFLAADDADTLAARIRQSLIPAFVDHGAAGLGLFRSSDEPNNFPALPFIEDERVVVWFASFASRAAFEKAAGFVQTDLDPLETFVLQPGPRSRLHHRGD